MVSTCLYDILMASTVTTSPLRYEVNYRNYFLVTQGRVKILLIPPKDTRYLYPINDYDILEFRTPVNPWKVQPEYQDDFDKIKTLEVELFQGMVMFIPAYWWYSIQFIVPETSVCSFKYRTHMNTVSIATQLILNVLQNMNTKLDTLEKRAFIKNQFQETTLISNTDNNTRIETVNGGGGGGSGGLILLQSLGSLSIPATAVLNVRGGNGSSATRVGTGFLGVGGGGGGGGGYIVLNSHTGTVPAPTANMFVNGGTGGNASGTGATVAGGEGGGWAGAGGNYQVAPAAALPGGAGQILTQTFV